MTAADAAFDQTEKVDRDVEGLSELLLRHPALQPDVAESQPEFLSQRRHLEGISRRRGMNSLFRLDRRSRSASTLRRVGLEAITLPYA